MALAVATKDHRRSKTALFLIACGWAGAAPHWIEAGKSLLPAITLAFVLGGYGLRTVLRDRKQAISSNSTLDDQSSELLKEDQYPTVDILVSARDEEAVISRLVERLFALKYPKKKLFTYIIDDGSQDRTALLLEGLKARFPALRVINRRREAGGGKSGALNEALKQATGEWLFILDADAQMDADVLHRIVSFAQQGGWSAVQLRKSVVNAHQNSLTRVQAMEMAMDALIQQGRLSGGGVVELRGNGQLIKRSSVEACGGFNEATVTDDLDLSFRLLSVGSQIGILWDPPIKEEAVETIPALWKQRQRWAEGGLQRFFDYWPFLLSNQLNFSQKTDIACFFLLQYALPVVSFVDLITTVITRTVPSYWPLSLVAFSISGLAYWRGCSTISEGPLIPRPSPFSLLLAISYLVHWFVVIPWVAIQMSIFPKRLIWFKTIHRG